jgi:hypothetical protein
MKTAVLLVAAALIATPAARVTRAAMEPVERSFNGRIERFNVDDPIYLLGTTRGLYLDGYGVVLTAEVELIMGPSITFFRQTIGKAEIARVHQRKLERVPKLRELMREALVDSAASLDTVPAEEQIVLGVFLFYKNWEDRTGLPAQIMMQATRKTLVDFKANRIGREALDSAIQVKEF